MQNHGITCQYTVRACPQQNGVTERPNQTIQEHVTVMLQESYHHRMALRQYTGETATCYSQECRKANLSIFLGSSWKGNAAKENQRHLLSQDISFPRRFSGNCWKILAKYKIQNNS